MHINIAAVFAAVSVAGQTVLANPLPAPADPPSVMERGIKGKADDIILFAHDGAQTVRRQVGSPSSWLECELRWFGTAPFCDGECPPLWRQIRRSSLADGFPSDTAMHRATGRYGLSSNSCTFGTKALCFGRCYGVIAATGKRTPLGIYPPNGWT